MKNPVGRREAEELAQELYDKVGKLSSALAPEYIEEFQELQKGIDMLQLFISYSCYE
jgi:hypothetical protein